MLENEFFKEITGGLSAGKFGAAVLFAIVGIFISLILDTTKRNPESKRTPFEFSWAFLFSDNSKRLVKSGFTSLLMIFISLRFAKELFGVEVSMFWALLLGLGIDKVFEKIKNASKVLHSSTPVEENLPT